MSQEDITYVFIDAQNLYLGIRDLGWHIDYRKLNVYLKEKYQAQCLYMYIGYLKGNQKLYTKLTQAGFDIIFKDTVRYGRNRVIKGNVDVDLTVDVIRKASLYNKAIFISADGDFCALYNYLLKEKGKEILILIPNIYKYSKLLLKYKGRLRFMNDLRAKIGE
ncbi:NYN domain-containing protein [bacterium]|nr:NYN domain-containing protein [bacterium]